MTPQHMTALARAQEVRLARAKLLREQVREAPDGLTGRRRCAALLVNPPDCLRGATVDDVLLAVPRVGTTAMRRLLRDVGVSEKRLLGPLPERHDKAGYQLSERQRWALAVRLLGGRVDWRSRIPPSVLLELGIAPLDLEAAPEPLVTLAA